MNKILISIKKNYLAFSYKSSTTPNQRKLINTNIISDNELLFSEEYIRNNSKLVSMFIKELTEEYHIRIISFQKNEMFDLLFPLISNISYIKVLYLFEETSLPYYICEKIIKSKYLKQLNCYNIPSFMLEQLDKYNIETTSRNEILFTSNFMETNNLKQFSKIFYKISIKLTLPLTEPDLVDLKTFCKINKYLRTIHLYNINLADIEKLVKLLHQNRILNVRILIHDNITDDTLIENLKKINKKVRKYRIKFQIVYSDEYLESNIMNQTAVGILKICGLIITTLIVTVIGFISITNYTSTQRDKALKKEIAASIKKQEEIESKLPPVEEIVQSPQVENPNGTSEMVVTNRELIPLLMINPDTVGYLKVKNTNIDYPVVQALDNEFYLKNDFHQQENPAGWVFMDYRNSAKELDQNTIFYGHNRYSNGVMFGTLRKSYNKKWYTNPENQLIQFDTMYQKMQWRIFSIYRIKTTTDYLQNDFDTQTEWLAFIKKLTDRSIYDFGVSIKENDKIISLSTCSGKEHRLVVHAVLETIE